MLGGRLAERQGQLLDFHLLSPRRPLGRLIGRAAATRTLRLLGVVSSRVSDDVGENSKSKDRGLSSQNRKTCTV